MAESAQFVPKCWMFIRMGDFQSHMMGHQQMNMGFFGVEPSTIMAKIVWLTERCQRLHSHLAPHGYDFELPSHNWDNDGEAVFTPSCRKYVTIENMLFNMTESDTVSSLPSPNQARLLAGETQEQQAQESLISSMRSTSTPSTFSTMKTPSCSG